MSNDRPTVYLKERESVRVIIPGGEIFIVTGVNRNGGQATYVSVQADREPFNPDTQGRTWVLEPGEPGVTYVSTDKPAD